MSEYINGYALALLSLAQEEKKLKHYKQFSIDTIEAIEDNEEIIHLLDSKSIELEERIKIVKTTFKKTNNNFINLLSILVERSKFYLIIGILKKFIKLSNNILNIKEGIVYSVNELTKKELEDIQTRTFKTLGYQVVLSNKLDAELVSGLKIIVGDEIIEDTVMSRLEAIKYELLKRKEN
ncbi:ATP synthase F1 subunit delta [Candidatus Mycoplasma mahonii]|uniref:ATP synthase F1 subunit delta n=1 Tax=Candidatus Mycoplasma mahonii TaxID=3004105 RepID=UPI0026ED4574|nr:ATP synthase F1 subunit delta [Candidatus Mycoplasma mahonii]WKX02149.1 ATP synthase F1 subunit delta [Candidatus Mycoplasma mahonii]